MKQKHTYTTFIHTTLAIAVAVPLVFGAFACKKRKNKEKELQKPVVTEIHRKYFHITDTTNTKAPLQFDQIVLLDEKEKESLGQIRESYSQRFQKSENEEKDFWRKMEQIARKLGFEPYWLYRVMIAESGINSAIQNPYTQATGLIQFMPSSAHMLGTTISELVNMTPYEQLDYVYKFYLPYKNKIKTPIDLYLLTFYPYARNKPNHYVIGSEAGDAYARMVAQQNRNFDLNKDGYILLSEYKKYIRYKVFAQVPDEYFSDLYETETNTNTQTNTQNTDTDIDTKTKIKTETKTETKKQNQNATLFNTKIRK